MSDMFSRENIKLRIETAAKKTIEGQKPHERKPWITDKIWDVIEQRKKLKQKGPDNKEKQLEYL